MMNPLYNAGIHLYSLGAKIGATRSPKIKKMIRGQKRTLDVIAQKFPADEPRDPKRPVIWIHVSSLGEFEQARPLIERIKQEDPAKRICLSFFSPSGYEVRKNYELADAVVYLPFDTPRNARRFIAALRPDIAIFVKYEFWGNYLTRLKSLGIPTYLVSAIFRPTQIFFKPWGGMFRRMLGCYERVYVQDEPSIHLLQGIGVNHVTRTGDTRLDRVNDVMARSAAVDLADFGANAQMRLIVGSSWQADEELYIPWLNAHPEVSVIIAPHEFDDARLSDLRSKIDGNTMLLSEWERTSPANRPADIKAIIVDSFGKLASIYRYGDVAYIGGGFGAGIHNINEAAVYGIPVVFGPKHRKFKEASDMIALGAGFEVTDATSMADTLSRLLIDDTLRHKAGESAGAYIRSNLGATDAIYTSIFPTQA